MKLLLYNFALVLALSLALPNKNVRVKDYTNYQVLRIVPKDEVQLKFLQATVLENQPYLDFWLEPRKVGRAVDISVSPEHLARFKARLQSNKIEFSILIENLQNVIDEEQRAIQIRKKKLGGTFFALDQYNTYDDVRAAKNEFKMEIFDFVLNTGSKRGKQITITMVTYMQSMASTYPDIASTFQIGVSYENRTMWGIKIGGAPSPNKKGFWIDGGIHAREWLAPSTALYIINTLITNYSTDPNVKSLVDSIDWYIAPCVNPDGYEYTWNGDRYWRKTRSRHDKCYGVDANRNWNFHWAESGSSPIPCSDTYEGPAAFSEPETLAMSNLLYSLKDSLQAYITLHTYGQLWLVPYGYAYNTYPPDYQQLLDVAQQGEAALEKVHGEKYTVENSAELYPASGASDDWSKGVAGIKFVYTLELRPANGVGNRGFSPDASQIIPTGEEVWAGVQVVAQNVLEL